VVPLKAGASPSILFNPWKHARYITPVGSRNHMDAAAELLGLNRLHVKAG